MVKLSELRNRSSSDAPLRSIVDVRARSNSDAGPSPPVLSPADSINSSRTWTASPSSIGSPAPSLGSPSFSGRKSFTDRHGGQGLTRKFSKKISFSEPRSPATPLATQIEEQSQDDESEIPISVPIALKGVFTDAQVRTFRQLFDYYDKDKSGAIDKDELSLVLTEMGEMPNADRVNTLMQEVDFDGNGVIDFEEFLHVMNEKRGGDSSFSAIVHKVEKKLNPLLAGHNVVFMHKGHKVTGTLIKKQGPFWSVELNDGVVVNSIPSSSLSRPVAPPVHFTASASSVKAASPAPSSVAGRAKPSMSKLSLNSVFKQVGVPDSPMSALSVTSEASQKTLPGFFAESKTSHAESKTSHAESKASKKGDKKGENKYSKSAEVADAGIAEAKSSFQKPSLGKFDSAEERKLFGEMKTTADVKAVRRNSVSMGSPISSIGSPAPSPATSPAVSDTKKPMGAFLSAERPKGAFEPREVPVKSEKSSEKETGQSMFDAEQVDAFKKLFKFYEKNGFIKKSEMFTILSQMKTGSDLPPNLLNTIIDKVDRGDGKIGFEAFLKGMTRAKATREYYAGESEEDPDSPIRTPRVEHFPDESIVKGGSSDEEEEEKWQEHRRNWFKKKAMTPKSTVWQGSPRSPSSPDQGSYHKTSGIVSGSSPNLGVANIDSVLASLFPRAKIQHSSNGTVLITPNPTSVIESPPTRLEEIIGRFGVSNSIADHSPLKSPDKPNPPQVPEEERREKALRGRNLIGGILTNQQSEIKARTKSGNSDSNYSTTRHPSIASSRTTPTDVEHPRPPDGQVISSAALRLEWAKQQASTQETPLSTKDLARYFAEEATPRPKVAKAPRRPPVVMKSTDLKIKKPSEPLKMSPSKLVTSGGALSSFPMCIYDSMGCVVSAVGRVVHVIEGSQAHRAGVECGNFVTGIGKHKVNSIETIQAALESVRRDAEFKLINNEINRRKDLNSPTKTPNITQGITPVSPCQSPQSLVEDKVLVILLTPGATKPHDSGSQLVETKSPTKSSYYAVL